MSLPDKDFASAWLMKAQSHPEQSQADNDSDAKIGMHGAENDAISPPAEESSARQKPMQDNFKDHAKRANDFVPLDANKFVTAIALLQTLRHTKASLDTCEATMPVHGAQLATSHSPQRSNQGAKGSWWTQGIMMGPFHTSRC